MPLCTAIWPVPVPTVFGFLTMHTMHTPKPYLILGVPVTLRGDPNQVPGFELGLAQPQMLQTFG